MEDALKSIVGFLSIMSDTPPLRTWVAQASKLFSHSESKDSAFTELEWIEHEEELRALREEIASLKSTLIAERKRFKDRISLLEEDNRKWKSRYQDLKKVAEGRLDGGPPAIKAVSGLFGPASRAGAGRARPRSAAATYGRPDTVQENDEKEEVPTRGHILTRQHSPPSPRSTPSPSPSTPLAAESAPSPSTRHPSPSPSRTEPARALLAPPPPPGHFRTAAAGTAAAGTAAAGSGPSSPESSFRVSDRADTEPRRTFRAAVAAAALSSSMAQKTTASPMPRVGSFSSLSDAGAPAAARPRSSLSPQRRLSLILAATARRRPSLSVLGQDSDNVYLARSAHRWHRVLRVTPRPPLPPRPAPLPLLPSPPRLPPSSSPPPPCAPPRARRRSASRHRGRGSPF